MWKDLLTLGQEHEVLASIALGAVMVVCVALVAAAMDYFVGLAEREDASARRQRRSTALRLLCFFLAGALTWSCSLRVAEAFGQNVPLASEADKAVSQLLISRDGWTVTVRDVADDGLRLCVAPRPGAFGPTRCFTAGEIRRGQVVRR
jgi:hypothetical protein